MLYRTLDREQIIRFLRHPDIGNAFGLPEDITDFDLHEKDLYWLISEDEKFLYLSYNMLPRVHVCHVYCKKSIRGKQAKELGKEALKWIFDNTDTTKIQTFTPEFRKHAYRFALSVGFKPEGFSEKAIMNSDNTYYGFYISGVSK